MASSSTDIPTKSVVIVGGGVAGLACGTKLASLPGFKVTLLEATDHIGGRVKSVGFGEGQVELGAQWVHGEKGNSVFELLHPYDVLEDDIVSSKFGLTSMFVTQNGEFLPDVIGSKVHDLIDSFHDSLGKTLKIKEDESLGEFAARIFWKVHDQSPIHISDSVSTGILDWIHRFQNHIDGADSWFVTSSRGQQEYGTCEGNGTISWKPPASYSTLLQVLLHGDAVPEGDGKSKELPKWIHLNKKVKLINYGADDGMVKVECQDGTKYMADYVVSTFSLGVLKQKHAKMFQPPLPREKINAIENLGFGVVDKIFLEFETAWWPEKSLGFNLVWDDCAKVNDNWLPNPLPSVLSREDKHGIPRWCRSLLGFYTMKHQPKTLFTWITGPPAEYMETLELETLSAQLVKVLQKFVGGVFTVPKPTGVIRSTWMTNSLTRGSYSFRTLATESKDASAADLAKPIFNSHKKLVVCFAGEATHPKFYSTVHGAYDSGLREARRIIDHAKANKSTKPKSSDESKEDSGLCCSLLDYV